MIFVITTSNNPLVQKSGELYEVPYLALLYRNPTKVRFRYKMNTAAPTEIFVSESLIVLEPQRVSQRIYDDCNAKNSCVSKIQLVERGSAGALGFVRSSCGGREPLPSAHLKCCKTVPKTDFADKVAGKQTAVSTFFRSVHDE
ncbi:hypothetical protein Y032_0091g2415 [Ancylostoma ceylanicum]|nr:hypothetical protein Y032_0091g2415 [Ancylostoma ceylanicum]